MEREQKMLLKMIDNMELSQENFNLLKDNLTKLLTPPKPKLTSIERRFREEELEQEYNQ
tara:strand:- start:123 stop:299 length:177 start_codon:yes stop_codon:yes gene_type:complete